MSASARPSCLVVYCDHERVGELRDTEPLGFEYDAAWLNRASPQALAAIPLRAGVLSTPAVLAFFENLLPEADLRANLTLRHKATGLFAMLWAVAGDTSGAFVLLPAGETPQAAHYVDTTWAALAKTIQTYSAAALSTLNLPGAEPAAPGTATRISLAGAQDKASIALWPDGRVQLPRGTAPSTHILKPNIRRIPKVRESAINETLMMRTAALCGLPTAAVFYEPLTQSCVVQRFDRVAPATAETEATPATTPATASAVVLLRLAQYDMCQLASVPSDKKYEKEGGPSLSACADLIRQHSVRAAPDLQQLVNWVFFNLFTGNNDSHAKNLSLLAQAGGGLALAPFYDLMCTRIYPGLSGEFAFSIGGQVLPGQLGSVHILALAKDLKLGPAFVRRAAQTLADRLPQALHQAMADTRPSLHPAGQVFADKLARWVLSNTQKVVARTVEK